MIYFILYNSGDYQFYGNLKKLCENEDLGYSKFSKHFARINCYEGDGYRIWKGEPIRGTKAV